LEGIVYAEMASKHSVEQIKNIQFKENVPNWNDKGTTHPEEMVLITQDFKEVQQIMSYYVGIVRSDIRLKRALDRLEIIYNETEELFKKSILSQRLCELRNLINIGYLVIRMAQQRGESRGLHYNIDHPKI
ncbi:MAG: L-aspartate oxidase, partial [Bacteroidota bacterium]|nr:L-aspartate oxidase [Bacteroidota bacterium]